MKSKLSFPILSLLFWLIAGNLNAQKLTGVVFDKENQSPVSNVHVFLDGSSLNDVTDAEGRFEIPVQSVLDLPLIISHISYHTKVISNPFSSLPDTIFVDEKDIVLDEIYVHAGRYSRKQLFNAFRKEFLGVTGAKSCIIENEGKIDLWYDSRTYTLSANCDEPVFIRNRYLGYNIYLRLDKFEAEYTSRRLGVGQPVVTLLYSAFFEDIALSNKNIEKRRKSVIEGSIRHFLLALANNQLPNSGYLLFHNDNKYAESSAECFIVMDTLDLKKVTVNDMLRASGRAIYENQPYFSQLRVQYNTNNTELIFFKKIFFINNVGNLTQPEDILFKGYMGGLRIGDLLPFDYK